ncbi:MAG: helix-turn-helix domain-containing protein [Pseudomonadota bacterium]
MDAWIETDARGRKTVHAPCGEPCAIERGMRLIGGKWTGSILWHLRDGPMRFNDLSRVLGGASKKVLSHRLAEMERAGLVRRNVLCPKPLAVSYAITSFGAGTLQTLDQLREWVEEAGL